MENKQTCKKNLKGFFFGLFLMPEIFMKGLLAVRALDWGAGR